MIYATGISFEKEEIKDLKSIVRIKLESDKSENWKIDNKLINGWYKKETIHRWLVNNRGKGFQINVKLEPYSELEPVENNGIKYVRAVADSKDKNNLLNLKTYVER